MWLFFHHRYDISCGEIWLLWFVYCILVWLSCHGLMISVNPHYFYTFTFQINKIYYLVIKSMIWCYRFLYSIGNRDFMWTHFKDSGMTQRSGNVTECHKKPASISGGARQRRGVTYSCVRLEFYPNYNRFYQISAEIGHSPLHTFSLHTSAMAGLLVIDGTWLERREPAWLSGMFMSHCLLLPSIRECVGRHFSLTLCWQG